MKILYLAPDPAPAPKGAAVRIARTLATLTQLGHEVQVLTTAGRDDTRLEGVTHDTVRLDQENFLQRMLAFRAAAADWLRGRRADLVQFRSIWEGLPAVQWAREGGARSVYEAHGFPSIELPYHFPELARSPALLHKLIREEGTLLGRADLLITPSQTGARYLHSRAVAPHDVAVVPNAVDPALFSPGPGAPDATVPLRLVYVGTLAPWQGLPLLLEALARLRSEAIELHVVGPARRVWRSSLRRLARRCRVHHLLHLSRATDQADLVPLLRTAHVCVAPLPADARNAVQGCCPLKVIEYMAVGRPILATRIAPLEELLQHEHDAWLAEPGSPLALAEGLAWMRDHPEEREVLGRRARETVLARFGPQHFVQTLEHALARVVG